jgi:ribose 5-phosphate isomerase B
VSRRRVVTEADVRTVAGSTRSLAIGKDAVITPAARDLARQLGVTLVSAPTAGEAAPSSTVRRPSPPSLTVALGADHGGYPLKEELKRALGELGCEVRDLGTHSTAAVDYPDFAVAVARAVADGTARFGIMVDGAGIGSSMAANKVPGVRAALCYDLTTAQNAREHNDANVLTLGGTLIGTRLALEIVRAFLATPFAGGRHAPRVAKINRLDGGRG